jgi:hypothetical protein
MLFDPRLRLALSRATVLAACAVLVLPGLAAARSRPPLRTYDCLTSSLYTGGYTGSVKLMRKGKYVYAVQRKGSRLLSTTRGRWRMHGRTIRWLSGPMKKAGFYGVWNPPTPERAKGFIALFSKSSHSASGIACYPA